MYFELIDRNREVFVDGDTIANIDTKTDTTEKTDTIEKTDTKTNSENRIYRFKFTDIFTTELYNFSKIHQYDERNGFKEAWELWIKENSVSIETEIKRLTELGYDGDILEKMFKSARYYFRKKSTNKKEPVKRRAYINVPKELLIAMDTHITNHLNNDDYKPKDGFNEFCTSNTVILKEGIAKICHDGITDSEVIHDKMKKTYKNRYFMITNK
jgi:hypothetical protein